MTNLRLKPNTALKVSVSLLIQSECGEIRTRKTPNMDTFHVVEIKKIELLRKVFLTPKTASVATDSDI